MNRQEKALALAEREREEIKRKENFMRLAIAQAKAARRAGEVPIGCVIVKDGAVIARAHNMRQKRRLATAHAEMIAIERACRKTGDWRLNGCEMYVTLEPCAMCAGAAANARISSVVFGAYEPKSGACGSHLNLLENAGLNSNTQVTGGILKEECSRLITEFFAQKRTSEE